MICQLCKAAVCDTVVSLDHLMNHYIVNMHSKLLIQCIYEHHDLSDATSTSLFISDVRDELNLLDSLSVSSSSFKFVCTCRSFFSWNWQHAAVSQRSEREWEELIWLDWLKSAVTHLLTVYSFHFTTVPGCAADASAFMFTKLPKQATTSTCVPCNWI